MKKITFIVGFLIAGCSLTSCVSNTARVEQTPEHQEFCTQENVDFNSGIGDAPSTLEVIGNSSVNDNSDKANYVTPSDLSEPFTNGSFTIQEPVSPWNENDIQTAFEMTAHYNIMTNFSDCIFADFTNDDIPEMLLICGHDRIFYCFEKHNDTISLLAKSETDSHICNGVFLSSPPLSELDFANDDEDVFYNQDKFTLYNGIDEQKYFIVYSWSGTLGEICEIKKIEIQGNEITFPVVYRWGLFKEIGYDSMNAVMRYQKAYQNTYEDTSQEEISDFLDILQK